MKQNTVTTRYIATPRLKEIISERDDIQSMDQLADWVGVKRPTISRFDSQGRYDINTLVSVMKVLDVNIDELFDIKINEVYVNNKTDKMIEKYTSQNDIERLAKEIIKERFNFADAELEKLWKRLEDSSSDLISTDKDDENYYIELKNSENKVAEKTSVYKNKSNDDN